MRSFAIGIFGATLWFQVSCSGNSPHENKTPVARVYEQYLYFEDLSEFPEGLSKEDSLILLNNKIELWTKKQLMLNKAEQNLSDEDKDISQIVEDYKASLLIDKYKREFLREKLDTTITDYEISTYYNQYSESFVSGRAIVKAHLLKIPVESDNYPKFKQLFSSNKSEDSTAIGQFIRRYAVLSNDYNSKWISFSELASMLPTTISNIDAELKTTSLIQQQDKDFYYLIRIDDYILRGDIKPLELVQEDITMLLINKKKTELINTLEINIYQNAVESGNIEIFSGVEPPKIETEKPLN